MENFKIDYEAIKEELEGVICSVHNKPADLKVTENNVQISACCEQLKQECTELATELIQKQSLKMTKKALDTMTKGFNRRMKRR